MTQKEFLLREMRKKRAKITTLWAHRVGICRLSERIRELETKGFAIKRIPRVVHGRFGRARVVEYQLLWK